MSKNVNLIKSLLDFIDYSPSPWHAVSTTVEHLADSGFKELLETEDWVIESGKSYYVVRDQSSIIAFKSGSGTPKETGFKIIGAHTDSPGLRIKPNPISTTGPWVKLGVEVYGGPILATFTDRDLSLAGRVSVSNGEGNQNIESHLVNFEKSILRLPNLAIHLNREVNQEGLKFNQQTELPLILELAADGTENDKDSRFKEILAAALEVDSKNILAWEMAVYDVQKGSVFGLEDEFYANSQLDNLASCHAALTALLSQNSSANDANRATQVIAFFDHEEVGSESSKGADGSFFGDVLSRISAAQELTHEGHLQALAKSCMLSADMAHAWHPNFADKHDPEHRPLLNHGPVIKINSNQKYTTNSQTEALFVNICEQAKIPYQKFVNRSDLSCGSTIGPLTAAKVGIASLDVGNPMWAMHSIRESAGVKDHEYMIRAMVGFLGS
jgi:aspartyl aminopeptidase